MRAELGTAAGAGDRSRIAVYSVPMMWSRPTLLSHSARPAPLLGRSWMFVAGALLLGACGHAESPAYAQPDPPPRVPVAQQQVAPEPPGLAPPAGDAARSDQRSPVKPGNSARSEGAPVLGQRFTPERGAEMLYFPAGTAELMVPGKPKWVDFHKERMAFKAFYLDRHEITVGEYRACVDAGGCSWPCCGGVAKHKFWYDGAHENFPVTHLSWEKARTYCRWADKRLPTAYEWTYAASGAGQTREYPWGRGDDRPGSRHALARQRGFRAACASALDMTPEGLCDMALNVSEWTSTLCESAPCLAVAARVTRSNDFRNSNGGTSLDYPFGSDLPDREDRDTGGGRCARNVE